MSFYSNFLYRVVCILNRSVMDYILERSRNLRAQLNCSLFIVILFFLLVLTFFFFKEVVNTAAKILWSGFQQRPFSQLEEVLNKTFVD